MKIKELGRDDRPREKLSEKGPSALSNAELLAVLLRTGTGKFNVVDTARMLLKSAGDSLLSLAAMDQRELCKTCGVGPDKAAAVTAAFELGRRREQESAGSDRISVTRPEMIFMMMLPLLRGLRHEECWVVFLNRANYVIGREKVSSGGLDSTVMDIKHIVRKSLDIMASGIILVHNHPSGNPRPGVSDIRCTEKLKKAVDTFDISLVDHIIVADDSYYSFSDEAVSVSGK